MGRSSQSHLRAREGYDSAGDTHYPGTDYIYDWPGTWPSGSGEVVEPIETEQVSSHPVILVRKRSGKTRKN